MSFESILLFINEFYEYLFGQSIALIKDPSNILNIKHSIN